MHRKASLISIMAASAALAAGCATNTQLGGGGTKATGSGGAAGSQGEAAELIRCDRPIGKAALLESDRPTYSRYGLSSPIPLLRLMMAQSGCFQVVDRGAASQAMQRDRELAAQGELGKGSAMGGGQMAAADFIITPNIVHQDEDSGGGLGAVGSFLPGVAGVVAGGIKTQNLEAQTVLYLTNVRTGVQEAVAEGSATKRDIGWGAGGFAGVIGAVGGGYQDTEVGKIVAAAFLDAHNKLVSQVRATQPASEREVGGGYRTTSAINFRSGASTDAPILTTLPAGAAVLPTGEKQGAWWQVEAEGKTGWLHSDYLTR